MEQERKSERYLNIWRKIIVKKIAILYMDVINASLMENQNAVIIIACILKDKINKMCTLKKWRID